MYNHFRENKSEYEQSCGRGMKEMKETSQRDDVSDVRRVPFSEVHPQVLLDQLRIEVRHTRITDLNWDRVRTVERTNRFPCSFPCVLQHWARGSLRPVDVVMRMWNISCHPWRRWRSHRGRGIVRFGCLVIVCIDVKRILWRGGRRILDSESGVV